ncbi:hypothetical protein EDB86DRAFT_2828887 [Lactarius hatsudake]|nr:hypothetical protein EDB86DRAFT_2828887 [Lactarius hatsudake]
MPITAAATCPMRMMGRRVVTSNGDGIECTSLSGTPRSGKMPTQLHLCRLWHAWSVTTIRRFLCHSPLPQVAEDGGEGADREDCRRQAGASLESGKCRSKAAKDARGPSRDSKRRTEVCLDWGNVPLKFLRARGDARRPGTRRRESKPYRALKPRGRTEIDWSRKRSKDNIKPKGQPSEAVKPLAEGWKGSQASQGLTCQSARTSESADARECADRQNATRALGVLADNEVTKAEGTRAIESTRGRVRDRECVRGPQCGGKHRWRLGQGGQAAQDRRQTAGVLTVHRQRALSAPIALTAQ